MHRTSVKLTGNSIFSDIKNYQFYEELQYLKDDRHINWIIGYINLTIQIKVWIEGASNCFANIKFFKTELITIIQQSDFYVFYPLFLHSRKPQ